MLLDRLKSLGLSLELGDRVADVIRRRNLLVHHFMEDTQLARAAQGEGADLAVDRIDQVAADCQALINEIAPAAISGVEDALGVDVNTLIKTFIALDPQDITDHALRAHVETVQQILPREWGSDADAFPRA